MKKFSSMLNKPFSDNSWYHNQIRGSHPASHWVFCQPNINSNELSEDGFLSAFSPPAPFSVRMWAGGNIIYHERSPYIGETVRTFMFLASPPVVKKSSTHGNLLFTTVETQIYSKSTNSLLMTETVNFVYKEDSPSTATTSSSNTSSPGEVKSTQTEKDSQSNVGSKHAKSVHLFSSPSPLKLDEISLFRFSALTWNAHKIHYDKEYAKKNGHENILVHGPLQATILLDALEKVSQSISPSEPVMEKRKVDSLMMTFTKNAVIQAVKALDPSDPDFEATRAAAKSSLENLTTFDLDFSSVPKYHLRHQKLSSFTYKCKKPLLVNSEVMVHAELLHDEDQLRVDRMQKMNSKDVSERDLINKTYWLREKPASVKVWISAKHDKNVVYTEGIAMFSHAAPLPESSQSQTQQTQQ